MTDTRELKLESDEPLIVAVNNVNDNPVADDETFGVRSISASGHRSLVTSHEALGYFALWVNETTGRDPFVLSAVSSSGVGGSGWTCAS